MANSGEWKEQLRKLNRLEKQEPRLFARIAAIEMKQGKFKAARKRLERGLKKFQDYTTAMQLLAQCYDELNKTDAAAALWNTVHSKEPYNPYALKGYLHLLDDSKNGESYEKAIFDYYQINPFEEQTLTNIRRHLLKQLKKKNPTQKSWLPEWHPADFLPRGAFARLVAEKLGVGVGMSSLVQDLTPIIDESALQTILDKFTALTKIPSEPSPTVAKSPNSVLEEEIQEPQETSDSEKTSMIESGDIHDETLLPEDAATDQKSLEVSESSKDSVVVAESEGVIGVEEKSIETIPETREQIEPAEVIEELAKKEEQPPDEEDEHVKVTVKTQAPARPYLDDQSSLIKKRSEIIMSLHTKKDLELVGEETKAAKEETSEDATLEEAQIIVDEEMVEALVEEDEEQKETDIIDIEAISLNKLQKIIKAIEIDPEDVEDFEVVYELAIQGPKPLVKQPEFKQIKPLNGKERTRLVKPEREEEPTRDDGLPLMMEGVDIVQLEEETGKESELIDLQQAKTEREDIVKKSAKISKIAEEKPPEIMAKETVSLEGDAKPVSLPKRILMADFLTRRETPEEVSSEEVQIKSEIIESKEFTEPPEEKIEMPEIDQGEKAPVESKKVRDTANLDLVELISALDVSEEKLKQSKKELQSIKELLDKKEPEIDKFPQREEEYLTHARKEEPIVEEFRVPVTKTAARLCIDQGKLKQATYIIKKLRSLFPADPELIALEEEIKEKSGETPD